MTPRRRAGGAPTPPEPESQASQCKADNTEPRNGFTNLRKASQPRDAASRACVVVARSDSARVFADLRLDGWRLFRGNRFVPLTEIQMRLADALMAVASGALEPFGARAAISYQALLGIVWPAYGYTLSHDETHRLATHVHRLRLKLEALESEVVVEAVIPRRYRMVWLTTDAAALARAA